jgi:hypothetical protein
MIPPEQLVLDMPWPNSSLWIPVACATALAGGCGDSTLANRVADQAATIAKLEIELQTTSEAREAAGRELEETKTALEAAEQARRLAEKKMAKSDAELVESSQARKQADAVINDLERSQAQLRRDLEAAQARLNEMQRERENRMAVAGEWRSEKSDRNASSEFVFNADGTGVYRYQYGWSGKPDDCQFRYRQDRQPGSYLLEPTRPRFKEGKFAIDPDGQSAFLSGWDAELETGNEAVTVTRGTRELIRVKAGEAK